jgi:CRP-like cAMP-binding protein
VVARTGKDRGEALRRVGFAKQLGNESLSALGAIAVERRVDRGQLITIENTPAEAMYLIVEGRVKISRYSPEGREQIMYTAETGGHFNTVPVFDDRPCPATTEALVPTTLLVLYRDDVRALIERYPEIATALLTEFATRLRHLVGLVEDLALHTVHGRLAKLLLQQAEAAERGAARPPMTQAEMAAHLGTVREMIGRTLKSFELAGLIELDRGAIRILDRQALRERAET